MFSSASGYGADASNSLGATASGAFASASGTVGGSAYGFNAYAGSDGATAVGASASAQGQNSTAIGRNTQASASGSVAIGTDSDGNGASASYNNQFVLGTANHTYTAPGLTSAESRARQTGPLEIVTSDAHGNLASDGGLLFREVSKLGGGIAIAMALENPDLVANERFGLAGSVAFWEGNMALGFSGMGVLGRNFVGHGERWALSAGVGFTVKEDNFGGRGSQNSVGGRAGLQVSW